MVLRGLLKLLVGFIAAAVIFTAIVGIGGYFAFRNFDPNMFRKQCEDYLAEKTGLRVEFGDIQLEWQPRPSLQVAGLKVYQPKTHQKVLSSERIQIDADLASIWKKRFVVSQILIQKPEVFLTRDRKGNWVWETIDVPASVPAAPPMLAQLSLIPEAEASEGSTGFPRPDLSRFTEGWELGVGKILVRDATLHVSDESREPALRFDIEKLDADIRPEASNSSYRFSVGTAILGSSERNLHLEGVWNLSLRSLDLDLRYGADVVALKGRLNFPTAIPHFEGKLDVSGLDIDSVVPSDYWKPYPSGRLSAKTQFVFDSTDPKTILQTLLASGTVEIKDGALRNRNVVRDVFEKLSSVIVVEGGLESKLPLEVKDMLRGRDTPFDLLEVQASAEKGFATVSRIQVRHSNYQLSGQGEYGLLDRRAEGPLELRLSKNISSHLAKKIREMALLIEGASGQIVLPLKVQGTVPDISVQPDLVSIGSKVLQEKATQALGEGIERLLGAKRSKASSGLPALGGGGSQSLPSGKSSDRDQLIQQGMALFAKFQGSQTAPASTDAASSGEGGSTVAGQTSDQEALVQEGMALLSKYREAKNQ